jgi:hypothetical protein
MNSQVPSPSGSYLATLVALRRFLFVILFVGLVGTATELVLLGHYQDKWQLIPFVVLGLAMLASLGVALHRAGSRAVVTRLFRTAMILLIVSGAAGTVLHYRSNMEFKLEIDPSLSGFALFWSVVTAQAPPALAPGNIALLGLLGFACTFRLEGTIP